MHTASGADLDTKQIAPDNYRWVWTVQGIGLALITFMSFFPRWHRPTEYLFFGLLALGIWACWWETGAIPIRTPLDLPLGLLIVWVLLSVPFSIDPAYSFSEWRKLVAHILVFYWAILVFRASSNTRLTSLVLVSFISGTLAVSIYAIVDFVVRGGTLTDRVIRARGPSSDYNWLSTYMVIALPVLFAASYNARKRWQRIASLTVAALAGTAEFLAYTRAGWAGIGAEGMAAVWRLRQRWLLLSLLLILFAVVVGFVVLPEMGYQKDTTDPWTLGARVAVWKLAIGEILEHPLVGIGYGDYNFVVKLKGHQEIEKADGPHSTFVMFAMGSGLPALIFLIWSIVRTFQNVGVDSSIAGIRGNPSPTDALGIAVYAMAAGFWVRNCFAHMFIGGLSHLYWILVALAIVYRGQPLQPADQSIARDTSSSMWAANPDGPAAVPQPTMAIDSWVRHTSTRLQSGDCFR